MLTLATILGVVAYWRYTVSERHLHTVFDELRAKGASLDVEECVTEVLAWHNTGCEAMQSLCDHSVPMALEHCLSAQDRAGYCDALQIDESSGKWTYDMCKKRGVSPDHGARRRQMKACGNAYGAIESFCAYDQKGVVL